MDTIRHDSWLADIVYKHVADGWDYHKTIKGSENTARVVRFLRSERKQVKTVYDNLHNTYIVFTKPH